MPDSEGRVTVDHPLIITDPCLAFMNFLGDRGKPMLVADTEAVVPLFTNVLPKKINRIPICDVLFLYCELGPESELVGSQGVKLRHLIKASRARVVVLASDTPPAPVEAPGFGRALGELKREWPANIIFVFKRNEPHLGKFLYSLFEMMWNGTSMMMAWVTLAPQAPGDPSEDRPSIMCIPEVTHIIFQKREKPSA